MKTFAMAACVTAFMLTCFMAMHTLGKFNTVLDKLEHALDHPVGTAIDKWKAHRDKKDTP